jgi:hypothetical protein
LITEIRSNGLLRTASRTNGRPAVFLKNSSAFETAAILLGHKIGLRIASLDQAT